MIYKMNLPSRCISKLFIGLSLLVFLSVYVYVSFLPGVWYQNTFLYKKDDGSFVGSDLHNDYKLQIQSKDQNGINFSFSVNEQEILYRLEQKMEKPFLRIYKNNQLAFEGNAVFNGEQYMLADSAGGLIEIGKTGVILQTDESLPTCSQLFNWYMLTKNDVRGNLMLLSITIGIVVLLIINYWLQKYILARQKERFGLRKGIDKVFKAVKVGLCSVIVILIPLSFIIH